MKSLLFAFKYLSKLRGNNLIKVITLTLGLTLGWIFLTQIVFIRSFNNFMANSLAAIAAYCFFEKKPAIDFAFSNDRQLSLF